MAETFFSDTFTAADGTLLTAHTSDSGHSWATHAESTGVFDIYQNGVRLVTAGTGSQYVLASAVCPVDTYTVEAAMYYVANSGGCGIVARFDPTTRDGYALRHYSSTWQLIRVVAGSETLIGSYSQSLSTGTYTITFELGDGTQRVLINGVERISTADTAVTGTGRIGITDYQAQTTGGKRINTLSATYQPRGSFLVLRTTGTDADAPVLTLP